MPRPILQKIAHTVVLVITLAACASAPEVPDVSAGTVGRPRVMGTRGPLSARQSKALIDRLAANGQEAGLLERHLAVEEAVAETPLVAGNRVQVLRDGEESFRALFDAISSARHHVNLEYYIIEDVECRGEHLSDLLAKKRREGIQVNIIYDSYGSKATPSEFFDHLRAIGVNLVAFNPVNPFEARNGYAPNDRDHRKILIVDGATAIIGGVNLSTDYQSHPVGWSAGDGAEPPIHWRDTDIRIDGPVVAQLQRLFLTHWQEQEGPDLPDARFFPAISPKGTEVVRIIGSTPNHDMPRYYVTLLSAIRTARMRVWLSAAYFVPTHQEKEDLMKAARRGVDVRLLLPGESDSSLALAVQHSHYSDLLESGVLIYETRNAILHSKTAVIDGVWSVVGSSNFDQRSVIFNDEVDAVLVGSDAAGQLEDIFEQEMKEAYRIDPQQWADRPATSWLADHLARLWESML